MLAYASDTAVMVAAAKHAKPILRFTPNSGSSIGADISAFVVSVNAYSAFSLNSKAAGGVFARNCWHVCVIRNLIAHIGFSLV
jgi:hypothetical protein